MIGASVENPESRIAFAISSGQVAAGSSEMQPVELDRLLLDVLAENHSHP
ncbi:MAG: hypothetical protein ACYC66_07000 [Chloroflexota bacterium]